MRYRPAVAFLVSILLSVAAAGPILAADGKSELSLSGSFFKPKEGSTVYALNFQVAMPVGRAGYVVLGPNLYLTDDDARRAVGLVLEFNLLGSAKSGPFVGGRGLYLVKDPGEGIERYAVDLVGGWKQNVGKGAAMVVYLQEPAAGANRDLSDLSGNVGVIARF